MSVLESEADIHFMTRAIALARHGQYTARPNPQVGCVIVRNQQLLAEGFHRQAGEPHAEIIALQRLSDPRDAQSATVYVTLEPCCHTGKTPPCVDALIRAQVARVVYGMQDPNPQVAGKGLQRLRDAGIAADGPLLEEECKLLNSGFIKRMQTGLPWVRCKLAMSLDGRTAMANGESQWITSPEAREDVQHWRARSCAVLTGIGTVLHDNPALTVRSEQLPPEARARQPLRVVLDRQQRLPRDAAVLNGPGETLVLHDCDDLRVPLRQLAARGCNDVLVEAGATLSGAFVKQGLVDELLIYMAPKLLGSSARPLLQLPLESLNQSVPLTVTALTAVGADWRIIARPHVT